MGKLDDPIGVKRGAYAGLGQYEREFDFPKIPPLKTMGSGNGEMGWRYTETPISSTQKGITSANIDFPFKVSIVLVGGVSNYVVSAGSITDGTNGVSIPLPGIFEVNRVASAGYVVIKATIDASLAHSGWGIAIQSDTDEVLIAGSPARQTEARLLLARIVSSGSPPSLSANTAISTSQRLAHGFINGTFVRVFESAPTHKDNL